MEPEVMAERRLLERLTASDLFLLLWDDYGWSTDIGGLAILDGNSLLDDEGRVLVDAVRRHLEPSQHACCSRRPSPTAAGMPGTGAATARSSPAAVGAVAAPRPARAAGGRVLKGASRPRGRSSRNGRLRGAARPDCRRAQSRSTAVDADADPDRQ